MDPHDDNDAVDDERPVSGAYMAPGELVVDDPLEATEEASAELVRASTTEVEA